MRSGPTLLLCLTVVLALVLVVPASAAPTFVTKWGGPTPGTDPGEFSQPRGIAVGPSGAVYVADSENSRVQKFTADGTFVTEWGFPGAGDGEFAAGSPTDVAVDASENVYAVDRGNNRVQKFTSAGVFVVAWGGNGSGDGQFNLPEGIATDADGNVYVAEGGGSNRRVQKFTSSGVFVTKWGAFGSGDGQFNQAVDVHVAADTSVYVVDAGNRRIQKFTSSGSFLTKWGSEGSEPGRFSFGGGGGVTTDAQGDVFVADYGNHRVQRFTPAGVFVEQFGQFGVGDGQFKNPYGVASGPANSLYVTERNGHRVQKFTTATAPPGDPPAPGTGDPPAPGTGDPPATAPIPGPPPVIFLHGFLGAVIRCDTEELWPNIRVQAGPGGARLTAPNFDSMRLADDGLSNGRRNECTRTARPTGALVGTVLGSDIYAGTVSNLRDRLGGTTRFYTYVYDWRKSPEQALAGLDALVEQARQETGASQVTLFGHSMGGLVMRWYIDDPARAQKVVRALTVGTPYWGSIKPWLVLVRGMESQGIARFNPLDVILHNPNAMQRWAQNLMGAYFLYPSASWFAARGGWLTYTAENGGNPFGLEGTIRAIADFHPYWNPFDFDGGVRGNATLVRQVVRERARYIDGFKTNGVDWRVVVGDGLETLAGVRERPHTWLRLTDYLYEFGDGTVPVFSALQGTATAPPLGENVPRHFICGLDHNALAVSRRLFDGVSGFLREGAPISLPVADRTGSCGDSGSGPNSVEIVVTSPRSPREDIEIDRDPRRFDPDPRGPRLPRAVAAQSSSLSLDEAVQSGLVDVVERGTRTVLVARGDGVTVRFSGRDLSATVTPLEGSRKGTPAHFGPVSGALAITGGAKIQATRNGRPLSRRKADRRPPVTRAVLVRRTGRFVLVRPRARDASGVRATFLRIGAQPAKPWRGPVRVRRSQIGKVRFGSVDVFGNTERPRRLRLRR